MKEDKYAKSLAKNHFCAIFSLRNIRKNLFTQIFKALYGDVMFVSLSGVQIWPSLTNRNIWFWFPLLMREFFAWGTHEDKSNIYSQTGNVSIAKSPKIGNVFTLHKTFSWPSAECRLTQKPGKSSVLYRKTENPFEPKICLHKGV